MFDFKNISTWGLAAICPNHQWLFSPCHTASDAAEENDSRIALGGKLTILRLAQCQQVDPSTGYSPPASPCRRSRRWCPRRQRSRGQRWVREGFCSWGCCCWAGSRRRCWTWRWSEGRPQGHRRRSGTKRRSGTRSSAVENLVKKKLEHVMTLKYPGWLAWPRW